MHDETLGSVGGDGAGAPSTAVAHPQMWAVNLVSDPIYGYLELTKRLTPDRARKLGLAQEEAAEGDLLDSAWLQRMRRISQLQSARWVFPTAEHSRFTHSLGVMHEAGLWARHLYPSLRVALAAAEPAAAEPAAAGPGTPQPSEGLVVETLRLAGLLHDVGHGPFAHFFDEHVLCRFPAPADPRRTHKSLTHEDLSQLIIERELGEMIRAIRRAPGIVPERDALRSDESIDPRWLSFLISKPPLADPSMPRWLRWLQPLLSGVFTVDNLDYVRRDAYLIGVSAGPVDVERLRRYSFVGPGGLSLYEPGLGALEMFLTARLFMYQQIYYHRSVRAIDLDMAEVFGPSIEAIFGDGSPADDLGHYADLDEYALLHQAALWARGEALSDRPMPGDGTVTPDVGRAWRAILLRRPRWRAETELRRAFESGERAAVQAEVRAALGPEEPGCVTVDLAEIDARPAEATATDSLLAIIGRDGAPAAPLSAALARLPAYALVARRYRRAE
ncbi:MAG TPA: HD domain-containing protein [Candidatus Limnocylindrales bacterium]